jgi:hypothetical protein
MVVRRHVVLMALRPDLTAGAAGDVLRMLNDPDLSVSLVTRRGWNPERYRDWLAATMRLLLLDPGAGDRPDPATR